MITINTNYLKLLLKTTSLQLLIVSEKYVVSPKYIYIKTKKEEFTLLDTIPCVAEFVLRRETVRRYETVL